MHDPDVVILLFASGKLVCKNGVNEKMVYDAVEKLMAELIQKGLLISLEIAKENGWMLIYSFLHAPQTSETEEYLTT
ncbi:MAG: hypothetical protein FGF53_07455 [Candidatus Brockarchaeota archaeon]|nr:hypothetical protein [Candidatus Brockarchaeota archaeon]MBO3808103.1 hypothetical protein [Candidatus Brockarchaeota archaeon]